METMKMISIPLDQTTELTIGGSFYARLNRLLIHFADSKGEQRLVEAVGKIKDKASDSDEFAYDLETLIILIRDVEQSFKDNGKVKETDVEYEPHKKE
jgi:hypothetical protein